MYEINVQALNAQKAEMTNLQKTGLWNVSRLILSCLQLLTIELENGAKKIYVIKRSS